MYRLVRVHIRSNRVAKRNNNNSKGLERVVKQFARLILYTYMYSDTVIELPERSSRCGNWPASATKYG